MQELLIPILSFPAPSSNTDYVVATVTAPSGVPMYVREVQLCPEGTVTTDGSFRYQAGVADGAGSGGTTLTPTQLNPNASLPSGITPAAKQGPGSCSLSAAQDVASLPASQALRRPYDAHPIQVAAGASFAVVANILGSTNGNIKFSGYILVLV